MRSTDLDLPVQRRFAGGTGATSGRHPNGHRSGRHAAPRSFELTGSSIKVSYEPGGAGAKARLRYRDPYFDKLFEGEDLTRLETALGEEITVTLQRVPDLGSTTFTLVIPNTVLEMSQPLQVRTIGVTTVRSSSSVPVLSGQLDRYNVTMLRGTAFFKTAEGELAEPASQPRLVVKRA